MGKKIKILTDTRRLIRDQTTPVRILVQFDKPTKVRGIRATFHAAEKTQATYTVTTTDAKGKTKTETRTATEYVDILKEDFLLQGKLRKGFFSRLGDSAATWFGGGAHEVIEPGEHEYLVNLKIPEHAPSSFKGKVCEVFYRLKVDVDLPIRIDLSEIKDLEVAPIPVGFQETKPVHVVFPDESGRSFWDKTFGKDVKLNLAVDRDTLTVGQQALAMLTVESPEPLNVDKMEINLVGKESSEAHDHKDSYSHNHPLGEIESPNVIANESVHEFPILVPSLEGPPTQAGTKFSVDWTVEVRLFIPWAKDPVIRVPVTVLPG